MINRLELNKLLFNILYFNFPNSGHSSPAYLPSEWWLESCSLWELPTCSTSREIFISKCQCCAIGEYCLKFLLLLCHVLLTTSKCLFVYRIITLYQAPWFPPMETSWLMHREGQWNLRSQACVIDLFKYVRNLLAMHLNW